MSEEEFYKELDTLLSQVAVIGDWKKFCDAREKINKMLKELESRRAWMEPVDDLWNNKEDDVYNEEAVNKLIERKIKQLNEEMDDLRMKFNQHIVDSFKQPKPEPTCDHIDVIDGSSTMGNTYKCVKCGRYRTDVWSTGMGGWWTC